MPYFTLRTSTMHVFFNQYTLMILFFIFLDADIQMSTSPGGTEAKFRGKSGNRALDPIPEKYKGKHCVTSSSIAKNGDSSKFVEVSEK